MFNLPGARPTIWTAHDPRRVGGARNRDWVCFAAIAGRGLDRLSVFR